MRDGLDTLDLLKLCDGFNTAFSILNALYCKKGGLVMAHHNDIRNGFADLDEKAFTPTHVYNDPSSLHVVPRRGQMHSRPIPNSHHKKISHRSWNRRATF